ncbi:hypothetical protein NOR53_3437 [gamma proteobacterium NOR5-3]|nr:hypothetical protein NOR53_3437 [gamma proteobacterium NOR5-3]
MMPPAQDAEFRELMTTFARLALSNHRYYTASQPPTSMTPR